MVIAVMCLLFLGVFQVAQLFAAKEFLNHAAARSVRAKTVGLNDFMAWKTARVGAIPIAGAMITPDVVRDAANWDTRSSQSLWSAWRRFLTESPASKQAGVEIARIPLYLGADHYNRLNAILDYEDWDTIDIPDPDEDDATATVSQEIQQDYPLRVPLHRAFYAADSVTLRGSSEIELHYTLYLDRN